MYYSKIVLFEYLANMAVKEEKINRFIYAMSNLIHEMKKGMDDCCMMHGNPSEKEFMLINYVGQKQNMKMSDLADSLSAPLSTVTSIVDKLVKKKYLDRYHSSDDRRVVYVTLASYGKQIFQTFIAHHRETAEKVLSHFKSLDQENLIRYLETIPIILSEKKYK